ncbi:MAG: hypothetical protein JXA99_12685 [Candidatus Lokiarchaeota archaeon]|nr:hypothetical protein [Candidatus Lokiarchaeota archaeon]
MKKAGRIVYFIRLTEYIFIIYHSYVKLTKKGRELGNELMRHSQLFELLLVRELDLTPKEARIEADKFNLLLSCKTIDKICSKYGHPKTCPCGIEILESKNCLCKKKF